MSKTRARKGFSPRPRQTAPTRPLGWELTAYIAARGEVLTWSLWISTAMAAHEMSFTASQRSRLIPKIQIWDCGVLLEGLMRRETLFLKRRRLSWCGRLDLIGTWIPKKKP